jgi:hypothetical protein
MESRHQSESRERNEPADAATKASHGRVRYNYIEDVKLGANKRPGADGIEKKKQQAAVRSGIYWQEIVRSQ